MIVLIQSKGNMRRSEILAAPLLLLNSIHSELVKIMANEMMGSIGKFSMGLMGSNAVQSSDGQQKDSRFGETKQFDSRDEYFNYVNSHS